ncbi:hypothetical protein ACNFH8_12125 [Pseudomonas sp. NY15436]|uniref:hypothetical protein n=1 Tax=Pseudomonas sp. NY15436 TaxID=3400359 RepID=UPI003A84940C
MAKKTPMTPAAAARIQRAEALKHGGKVTADSFPARAQKAAAQQQKTADSRERKHMAKGSSSGSKGGAGQGSGSKGGTGGGRPATGFPGGNWPSTTGNPSGPGRGNAPSRP